VSLQYYGFNNKVRISRNTVSTGKFTLTTWSCANDLFFLDSVKAIFNGVAESNVTLNAKIIQIGVNEVVFVGHTLDATGINMTQKRIEGAITFAKPTSISELQFFGTYEFRDHLRDH
jgi:hypothetical protein